MSLLKLISLQVLVGEFILNTLSLFMKLISLKTLFRRDHSSSRLDDGTRHCHLPIPVMDGDILARDSTPCSLPLAVHLAVPKPVLSESTLRLPHPWPVAHDLPAAAALLPHKLVPVPLHLRRLHLGGNLIPLPEHDLGRLLLELPLGGRNGLLNLAELALPPAPLALLGRDAVEDAALLVVALGLSDDDGGAVLRLVRFHLRLHLLRVRFLVDDTED